MTEYIERQSARPDEFCVGVSCQECPFLKDPLYGGCRVDDFIMAIPPADVKPVVRGKWINTDAFDKESNVKCSECETEFDYIDGVCYLCAGHRLPNFCPSCGADMRGENDG